VNQNIAAIPQYQVALVKDNMNGVMTEIDDLSGVIYAPISMFIQYSVELLPTWNIS